MASAAITLSEQPATVESDSTSATITISTALLGLNGFLTNHGPADVWCSVSVSSAAADTVVTTGAQAQLQVPLPAGSTLQILPHYTSIKHLTASGIATLSFRPAVYAREMA